MVKLIGVLLILSSVLALGAGTLIDLKFGSDPKITGNVISDIIKQPEVNLGFFDYVKAIAFSYSIFSFIMGCVFLVRV